MASTTLYPPLIDSTMPAVLRTGAFKVYFELSPYSTSTDFKGVHISIIEQSTGRSAVYKTNHYSTDYVRRHYAKTGIIIANLMEEGTDWGYDSDKEMYWIKLYRSDFDPAFRNPTGDEPNLAAGKIYKIQIRLSAIAFDESAYLKTQFAWLNDNANQFSEWSTVCTVKITDTPTIDLKYNKNTSTNITSSLLEVSGSYTNTDKTEYLYSYNMILKTLDSDNQTVLSTEESEEIIPNEYVDSQSLFYNFNTEIANGVSYQLVVNYTTINNYSGTILKILTGKITEQSKPAITLVCLENIPSGLSFDSFLDKENDEGRFGFRFHSDSLNSLMKVRVLRASSKDNYKNWYVINSYICNNKMNTETLTYDDAPDKISIQYDNTIESGVWYQYCIQICTNLTANGVWSAFSDKVSIIRDFNYSYLLGENGKQLDLKYNNTLSSYAYNYPESKTDTIGGKYPIITRNGNVCYRTFSISGLLSFNMDENNLFVEAITDNLYNGRKTNFYDYKREMDFREAALAFLQDGKPKLFKSPTEGNILIRLLSVTTAPQQSLNRMIYSFSATAVEIAEANEDNYAKYNII